MHTRYHPTELSFGKRDQAVSSCLHTGGERRRLMPSGLAEKQTPRTAITETRLLPSFPSCMMWRCNSSVKKRRLFFFPLIIAWESQGFYFFFIVPLSVIVRESHYYLWQLHSLHSPWQGQRQMECSDYLGFIFQYCQNLELSPVKMSPLSRPMKLVSLFFCFFFLKCVQKIF